MYIYPSLFRAFGGEWFDASGRPTINSKAGVDALTYYVDLLTSYAPSGVVNWNWPEVLDAFVNGTVVQFIDASSPAAAVANPTKSRVVGKVGFGRWPKGPTGKRVTSIWNWSFPINSAISERAKVAAWLWIQWMASKPVQIRTSYGYTGQQDRRAGVNRQSLWQDEQYRKAVGFGPGFADTVLTSLREDTDIDWRPRVPQWPEIGNVMATAIQKALVKQATPSRGAGRGERPGPGDSQQGVGR
jgi:multiple sugar transport system substrate-binding protein